MVPLDGHPGITTGSTGSPSPRCDGDQNGREVGPGRLAEACVVVGRTGRGGDGGVRSELKEGKVETYPGGGHNIEGAKPWTAVPLF